MLLVISSNITRMISWSLSWRCRPYHPHSIGDLSMILRVYVGVNAEAGMILGVSGWGSSFRFRGQSLEYNRRSSLSRVGGRSSHLSSCRSKVSPAQRPGCPTIQSMDSCLVPYWRFQRIRGWCSPHRRKAAYFRWGSKKVPIHSRIPAGS